jgi:hypothetical protein
MMNQTANGTVRILSLPQGKLRRTVKLGEASTLSKSDGSTTQYYWRETTLSPDGRWLAAAPPLLPLGESQNVFALVDLSSGELRYLRLRASDKETFGIPGIPSPGVQSTQFFTFNRDGRRIAAGLSIRRNASVSVLDTSSGAEIMFDRNFSA